MHYPADRPHTPHTDRMYATDVRQTDVRQHRRLMPLGRILPLSNHKSPAECDVECQP